MVEPYANPFRTYPLEMDYTRFKTLIADGVACYVLNTGAFMGKKVKPADTLGILEAIVEGTADFKSWGPFEDIKILDWPGFEANLNEPTYRAEFKARMADRVSFVESRATEMGGADQLPADALKALEAVVTKLK